MRMYECNVTEKGWEVYENASELVVDTFVSEQEARSFIKFLNMGGGFNGFTPAFMTRRTYNPGIDEAFENSFPDA